MRWWLASALVLVPSCTLLEAYPALESRSERSPEECADGRDDDGDGDVDLDDPSCWPEASTEVTRCTSLPADSWIAEFDGLNDGWLSQGGEVTYASDGAGLFPHDVLVFPRGAIVTLAQAVPVTGGIDGLTLTTTFYYGGGTVWLGVVSTAVPPPGAPSRLMAELASGAIGLDVLADGSVWNGTAAGLGATPAGWMRASIQVSADRATLTVQTFAGEVLGTVDVPLPYPLAYGSALRFQMAMRNGGRLAEAALSRPAVRPCGVDIPAEAAQPDDEGYPLAGVITGDGTICVAAGNNHGPVVHSLRSDDGGQTFHATAVLTQSTGVSLIRAPCIALAFDRDEGEIVGFVRTFDDQVSSGAFLVRSSDCATWTTEPVADPDAWPFCPPDYAILGTGSDRTHELWGIEPGDEDALVLTRRWARGRLSPDTVLVSDPPVVVRDPLGTTGFARARVFGGDLVVDRARGGGLDTFVVDRATGEARPWTTVSPSRIEGACDAASIGLPARLFDPAHPSHGVLLSSCEARPAHLSPVVAPFAVGP